ncbi:helix-turn-helix transcriptional regulator [uncultured Rothia sp.]|uniref:helix-turn-helix transcriptional regulator n=1 Tax=uncultured Rothia sp. TaxID=316088 RepID=UPI0032165F1C
MPELIVHLKQYRTGSGLTQAQLGDAVGVSRKTINTIENGVFTPSTVLALKLAQYFDTHVEDLFELNSEEH